MLRSSKVLLKKSSPGAKSGIASDYKNS